MEKNPSVDYQSWLHAESGRRVPTPATLIEIGKILDIDRESLIIAYCQDKFCDPESLQVIESFKFSKFVDANTLIDARAHDRSEDYILTAKQIRAMCRDIRLRLFLTYTYDKNYETTISRLAEFFVESKSEVRAIVTELAQLELVTINGEIIKRIHPHTTIPKSADAFELRRQLVIKGLELNLSSDSYISNCHAQMTEESFKKFLAYLDFAEANYLKFNNQDQKKENISQYQVTLIGNRIKKVSSSVNK